MALIRLTLLSVKPEFRKAGKDDVDAESTDYGCVGVPVNVARSLLDERLIADACYAHSESQ
jgi:hypothetical protein